MGDPITMVAMGLQLAGGFMEAQSIKAAGKAQMQQAQYVQKQAYVNAGQERASSQRAALEEARMGELGVSKATALAAGGGGTAESIYGVLSGIKGEEAYRKNMALYEGEDRARVLESQGDLSLYEGKIKYATAKADANTTMMKSFGKAFSTGYDAGMFGKYNPSASSAETISWNSPRYETISWNSARRY